MTTFLRIEALRTLRNRMYVLFTIGFPVVFYVVFSNIGVTDGSIAGTSGNAYSMVSMAAFGAISAAVFIGGRISTERRIGWTRQLRMMAVPGRRYLGVKVLTVLLTAFPCLVLVFLAGALINGVQLSAWRWLAIMVLLLVGVLPFAALGVAIGYLVTGDSAQPLAAGVYMLLSLFGGLWFPADLMPVWMRDVAHTLPTYNFADLGWRVLADQPQSVSGIGILAYWGLLFTILALVLYRKDVARPSN